MFFLAMPAREYKESYIQAIKEFQVEGRHQNMQLAALESNFDELVQLFRDDADPRKVKPGLVPQTTFWLIDDGEFIGRVSIRHELDERLLRKGGHIGYEIRPSKRKRGYGTVILRLGLEKAREMGLLRVLVTCDEDNIGSRKIIEHNGGMLENRVEIAGRTVKVLRFWIDMNAKEEIWQAIVEADYRLPDDFTIEQLTPGLLTALASPDPRLRDVYAYPILGSWIDQGEYPGEQLYAMLEQLTTNLAAGLGEVESDSVFLRSFSALIIAEIIKYDNAHPFLDETIVRHVFHKSLTYLLGEQDLRGHLPDKGWVHAIAHAADLLGGLACNRYLVADDLEHLLSAIEQKLLTPVDHVYISFEDERLALAVHMILSRGLLSIEFVCQWLERLTQVEESIHWQDTLHFADREHLCAYQNVRMLLHSLYFQLSLMEQPLRGTAEIVPEVVQAMKRLDPGFYTVEALKTLDPGLGADQ
jgi:predicted acetyltransferase